MSEADAGAPPPKMPTPSSLPEWIMAITGIGTLLLAVVAITNSSRIGGIEDYLQSEIALRNRQVMHAEDRAETANRERARAAEDASFSQRQLTYNEFADVVGRMGPTGVYDGFLAQYDDPPRALPALSVNPGTDLLERVIAHYRDSDNAHEIRLARRLRSRCAEAMNTPLSLAAIPAALPEPTRADTGSRNENYERYAAALAERRRSIEAFGQAEQTRQRAIREAHANASRALHDCALEILNGR